LSQDYPKTAETGRLAGRFRSPKKEPIQNVIRAAFPFLIVTILSLPLFLFVPWLSLWLPKLMGH